MPKSARGRPKPWFSATLATNVHDSADVNAWTAHRIRFRLPQDLAGDRRRISLTEGQELEQVSERIALGPAEVRVRDTARLVPDVKKQRRDRVRYRRADAAKDVMAGDVHAVHEEGTAEFGDVAWTDFEEEHTLAG